MGRVVGKCPRQKYLFFALLMTLVGIISLYLMKITFLAKFEYDSSRPIFHGQAFVQTRKYGERKLQPVYNVMFLFSNAKTNKQLQTNFRSCISSLMSRASIPPTLHIVGDSDSFTIVKNIIHNLSLSEILKVNHHDHEQVQGSVLQTISSVHEQLGQKKDHQFSDPLFYLSMVMHRIMPSNMSRVIMFDVDLIFKSDIMKLFRIFDNFNADQAIGIARENQPVYRNVFWEYRKKHPETKIGEPPPDGLPGFNSGVLMLDLHKLRKSATYNSFFDDNNLLNLVDKYEFQGHLGDQDFFTLLSFEADSLFYTLPCGWNRQLCTWWKRDDFMSVFDEYYKCDEPVHVVHGNCKTSMLNYTSVR